MRKYEEKISDTSIWVTSTPTGLAKELPFYISEAGHFTAENGYKVSRDTHDSFLLLYTISGKGFVNSGDTSIILPASHTAIIDCRIPHEYHSMSDEWEFLWIHFGGISADALFNIIYPDKLISAINMSCSYKFRNMILSIIDDATKNDIVGYSEISLRIHSLLNQICIASPEHLSVANNPEDDISKAISFIESNYASHISIEDMINDIHISKYHFIRSFRRSIGVTPYNYLINYRINISKILLRSTDKTISEIAEDCGFLDASNFISQFKKHTGQRPLQYRKDFTY